VEPACSAERACVRAGEGEGRMCERGRQWHTIRQYRQQRDQLDKKEPHIRVDHDRGDVSQTNLCWDCIEACSVLTAMN